MPRLLKWIVNWITAPYRAYAEALEWRISEIMKQEEPHRSIMLRDLVVQEHCDHPFFWLLGGY